MFARPVTDDAARSGHTRLTAVTPWSAAGHHRVGAVDPRRPLTSTINPSPPSATTGSSTSATSAGSEDRVLRREPSRRRADRPPSRGRRRRRSATTGRSNTLERPSGLYPVAVPGARRLGAGEVACGHAGGSEHPSATRSANSRSVTPLGDQRADDVSSVAVGAAARPRRTWSGARRARRDAPRSNRAVARELRAGTSAVASTASVEVVPGDDPR